jgi:hypothetical protein
MNETFFETRNREQVVSREYRRTSNGDEDKVPILMVPHLWLWKVDQVILTAYSMTDSNNIFTDLEHFDDDMKLQNVQIGTILASQIILFGKKDKTASKHVVFRSPLCIFETAVFSVLSDVQRYVEADPGAYTIPQQKNTEQRFIHDIIDIHSELDMIQYVLEQQKKVLDGFLEDTILEQEADTKPEKDGSHTYRYYAWGKIRKARKTLDEYGSRIQKIHRDAELVEKTIDAYLNVKRTYASIEDTRNNLMVGLAASAFAFVTVVFTPLSFMTSLFALPVDQFVRQQTTDPASDERVFTSSFVGGYTGMLPPLELVETTVADVYSFGRYFDLGHDIRVARLRVLSMDVPPQIDES